MLPMIGNNIELFSEWHEYAHEAVVDSFVYENCSHGVDTFTEFCTGWSGPGTCWALVIICAGSKLLTAYTMKYRYTDWVGKIRFQFVQGMIRQFQPGDTSWNNNGTIIRPGARYQVRAIFIRYQVWSTYQVRAGLDYISGWYFKSG